MSGYNDFGLFTLIGFIILNLPYVCGGSAVLVVLLHFLWALSWWWMLVPATGLIAYGLLWALVLS